MGELLMKRVSPSLLGTPGDEPCANAYFGVRIESSVDLLEAREYEGLERGERLRKALAEQHGFLNSLLATSLGAAFDLRILVQPDRPVPLEVAILGRTWADDPDAAGASGAALARQIRALLPRHVVGTELGGDELSDLLDPFSGQELDTRVITKCEITGIPSRPDAKVGYYFSIVPFNWVENDWTSVYAGLAASPVPVMLSVGLLPLVPPVEFTQQLLALATFYGRLAREDQTKGGLYYGEQRIPPDAFAVEAEQVFQDLVRRCGQRAFGLRIQLASPSALAPGIAESIAAAISPIEVGGDNHLNNTRAGASYEIRRPKSDHEAAVAQWNLTAIDFRPLEGRADIWQRSDPPHPGFRALALMGDARDASCAFRLPVAIDGVVPGFRVGRGQFGHSEAFTASGSAITIGELTGSTQPVTLPLNSLTKHALIAGSTGSGKTTTVLELLRQLWVDHRIPFLVVEPVNSDADDYRKLLGESGFSDLEVITVGDDSIAPLRFNPFEVPLNTIVGEHTANLLASFKAAFGLWEPLPSIYQDALNLTYLRAGILSSERAGEVERTWPTAIEFMRAMSEATEGLGYAGEVKANIEAASTRRAQQMASGATASTFLTDQPNDIGRLLDHPVVIELKALGSGDEQALMIALLLNAITEHYQSERGASADLVHVTVIEEAHRLLARPSGGKGAEEAQAKEK
ncbi:MAG: ATP-binding protein, partial [Acidimicrobiales bacterium]